MSTSRKFEPFARALLTIAVAGISSCGSDGSAVITGSLSALHAESDVEEGGRVRDALGREVLLRGVNVNSLGEYYAFDPEIPTVHPFDEDDADAIQSIGWNLVRLILDYYHKGTGSGISAAVSCCIGDCASPNRKRSTTGCSLKYA